MLTPIELEELFDQLGIPESGRRLVMKARKDAPVRQVRSNGGNVITRYCSKKMSRVIETESRSAEFFATVRYELDPSVLEYYPQPTELDIVQHHKNGKTTRFSHTPDFLVIRKDGIWIEEWRQVPRLLSILVKHPDRIVRDASGWRCPPAEDQFREMGLTYHLRSADEHPVEYVQNLIFLANYLDIDFPAPNEAFVRDLQELFRERPAIHLRELLDSDGFDSDDVYKAIANGTVAFDLMNDDISETDRVLVFRDETTMMFHRKVGVAPLEDPLERLDASISIGGLVRYDDHEYEVALVNSQKVLLQSGPNAIELPLTLVENLYRQGKLGVISRPKESDPAMEAMEAINQLPPKALDLAIQRMELVELSHSTPNSLSISLRTLQRYTKAIRGAGDSVVDQHLAIAPRIHDRGNRRRKIPQAVIDLIAEVVKEKYNTPINSSKAHVYLEFVAACHTAELYPCSHRTFLKELAKHKSTRAREGKRRAYQDGRIVHYLGLREAIHGVRPFQIVHLDHTELQIILRVPGSKRSLGRAWLSLAVDAESRAIVGFYLSFEPPSYRSCMMVLRDIVRRHGRMPEMIVLDNGKEFHSRAFHRVCALYGCSIRYRPSGQPRHGSVMERLFGTTQSQLINNLAGNTQVLRHARMATKAVMPENFVYWTLPALHGALDYYFENIYGKDPHPAHGDGPVEHLRTRLIQTGERRMRMVGFDHRFMIETCPSPIDGDTRIVDIQRGVKINHIWYWNDALRAAGLKGKPIQVRVDPWDVRYVFVLIGRWWYRCVSKLVHLVRSYTEVELRCACEEMAVKHSIQKKDLSPERLAERLAVMDAGRFDPRLLDSQAEARLVYDQLGMASVWRPEEKDTDLEPAGLPCRSGSSAPALKQLNCVPNPSDIVIDMPCQSEPGDVQAFDDDYDLL